MKHKIFSMWWAIGLSVLLLAVLSSGLVYAQGGTITVDACLDQNADGDCDDVEDGPAPAEVEACLNDDTTCQPVPATFSGLAAADYTPFLRFTGASQGHYPTTPNSAITLAAGETISTTLGAVYPIHPKGIAVHAGLNKVYAAFQGPTVISGTTVSKPYPFVAVIDGTTDEVLQTIPGGADGIGEGAWGVAVSGDTVYVGAFEGGRISVIDAISDTVVTNIEPSGDFAPTSPTVNPVTGWVQFPDYQGGRMVILSGSSIVAEPLISNQFGFSPFETAVASTVESYTFTTMRDAIFENEFDPTPFKITGFNGDGSSGFEQVNIIINGENPRHSGSPHAMGLWQEQGQDGRLFVTYADDTRLAQNPPDFINPNKMVVYSFPTTDPKNLTLRNQAIEVGDYAEVGLVYNETTGHMLGTYAGFAYDDTANGHVAACDSAERGGTYAINFDGGYLTDGADAPNVWQLPETVVGNPALSSDTLQWRNPFEIAINPNNGKVYVTDRCWNEFPGGGQPGGGAVLIFNDEQSGGGTVTPTPTPTTTLTTTLVMSGPTTVNPGELFTVDVIAQNVPAPGLYGVQFEITYDPALLTIGALQRNANLSFVVQEMADPATGLITLVATQQGQVPGLTGDVTLLSFEATAANTTDTATLSFQNVKIGDITAQPFTVTTEDYSVNIGNVATSTPTITPTPTLTNTPVITSTPTPTITPTPTLTSTPVITPTPTLTPTMTPTPTITSTPVLTTPTPTITPTPTLTSTPVATTATVSGQIVLEGQPTDNWNGASVTIDDSGQSDTTVATGTFTITNVATGATTSITADAVGYLPAVCTGPTITAPETVLNSVTLLSGDLNDDNMIDITDATTVGTDFGQTGAGLTSDLNNDGLVDIFDIILVSANFQQSGAQLWTCQ